MCLSRSARSIAKHASNATVSCRLDTLNSTKSRMLATDSTACKNRRCGPGMYCLISWMKLCLGFGAAPGSASDSEVRSSFLRPVGLCSTPRTMSKNGSCYSEHSIHLHIAATVILYFHHHRRRREASRHLSCSCCPPGMAVVDGRRREDRSCHTSGSATCPIRPASARMPVRTL